MSHWGWDIWAIVVSGAVFVGVIAWALTTHDDVHLDPPDVH